MTIANGTWISAYADPASVAFLLPVPGAQRICGQVVACKELPPFEPGAIPTCAVTIKGRTGKQMVLDFTACYGKTHESKAEAIAEADNPQATYEDNSPTTPRTGQASRNRIPAARSGGKVASR